MTTFLSGQRVQDALTKAAAKLILEGPPAN